MHLILRKSFSKLESTVPEQFRLFHQNYYNLIPNHQDEIQVL